MNPEQQTALCLAIGGHNFCLTGQAGTGKTFAVMEISKELEQRGMTVAKTCTTGMATMQYYGTVAESRATTLHSWSGIHDGRYRTQNLIKLIETNEKFAKVRDNILTTDVLFIDEISMLSKMLFEQFEEICRAIRKCDVVFGGMQVIAVGDFYQLPPVPSPEYGDMGDFCVTSELWINCFPHHVNLTKVIRQKEDDIITAVEELARGAPSEATNMLLRELARPLSEEMGKAATKLCARNIDVEFINDQMLSTLEGEAVVYQSADVGKTHNLKKIQAQKKLTLKVGCPVILVTNLELPLVNGLQGVVTKLEGDGPTVKFPDVGIETKMKTFIFSVYNRATGALTASRKQFPLRVSYALTIHKAQGMSLDGVQVDCRGATIPGQIAVAIGRCKTKAGLRVLNYHPSLIRQPANEICSFYSSPGIFAEDAVHLCCRNVVGREHFAPAVETSEAEESELSDFTPVELQQAQSLFSAIEEGDITSLYETQQETRLDAGDNLCELFKVVDVFKSLAYREPFTDEQVEVNVLVETIQKSTPLAIEFGKKVWEKLCGVFDENCSKLDGVSEATKSKRLNNYHSKVFSLLKDESLAKDFGNLIGQTHLSDDAITLCSKFILKMSTFLLQWKSTVLLESAGTSESIQKQCMMSEDGKGKVRYVGGMCVAKLRYRYIKQYHNCAHSKRRQKKVIAVGCREKIQVLSSLEESYSVLAETSECPQTLEQTKRKQNVRCSLTNINDGCLDFFLNMEYKRKELSTIKTLHQQRGNVLQYVQESVTKDEQLHAHFMDLVKNVDVGRDSKVKLFEELTEKYVGVGNNEFRKELKEKFIKRKKFSHRVQVATAGKSGKKKTEQETKSKATAEAQGEQAVAAVKKTEQKPTRSSSSGAKRKSTSRKKKIPPKKSKSTREEDEQESTHCPVCNKLYEEGGSWICCDRCDKWFDNVCAGLKDDVTWEYFTKSEAEWVCDTCKNV